MIYPPLAEVDTQHHFDELRKHRRRRCPACWQRVRPTEHRKIEGHWDSASRDVCPGSYEPYRITLSLKPTTKDIAA